jgi:hypothetical protein
VILADRGLSTVQPTTRDVEQAIPERRRTGLLSTQLDQARRGLPENDVSLGRGFLIVHSGSLLRFLKHIEIWEAVVEKKSKMGIFSKKRRLKHPRFTRQ